LKKIYVGNLPRQATESELEGAFTPFGTVRSVAIIRDRMTGESRGFGFVEMDNDAEAKAAIDGLNGKDFNGRTLTVNEARPQERRSGGGGGRGEFRGGGGGGRRR
jgi:RNA recognition motif-containing protein